MAANNADFLPLTSENLITAFQNELILWKLDMRGTEEDKELAWRRIADIFNIWANVGFRTFEPLCWADAFHMSDMKCPISYLKRTSG